MAENHKSRKWPAFITKDLGDSAADSLEMERRWITYRDEMAALIAAGGVHQDADGWWVDDATGELIGPDPEIERPLGVEDVVEARPFAEALPHLAESIRRTRGTQKAPTKISATLRLDPEVLAFFKAGGRGWQSRINDALKTMLNQPGQ
jgi:uncharacterized protein (DUF4415 family)